MQTIPGKNNWTTAYNLFILFFKWLCNKILYRPSLNSMDTSIYFIPKLYFTADLCIKTVWNWNNSSYFILLNILLNKFLYIRIFNFLAQQIYCRKHIFTFSGYIDHSNTFMSKQMKFIHTCMYEWYQNVNNSIFIQPKHNGFEYLWNLICIQTKDIANK